MGSVTEAALASAAQALLDADAVAEGARARAMELDRSDGFPVEDVDALHRHGLLTAPLPMALGGRGLCDPASVTILRDVLTAIGRGSLALGRLYEGHVNALTLILRYGTPEIRTRLAQDACDGHLFGVWNTEPDPGGLALKRDTAGYVLAGVKSYASGAGHVTRPLVTARTEEGRRAMLVVPLEKGTRADLTAWRPHGMRATATGTLDFTGLRVGPEAFVGELDDYFQQPAFSGGAWRFLAVQLGGVQAVFETHRAHLKQTGRGDDPCQRARLGEAAIAAETARLFVAQAALVTAGEDADPERIVAFVNLARLAVERAALDTITLAQRSIGLGGFLERHPLERLVRDLATYLRQPAPDHALSSAAGHILVANVPIHALWQQSVAAGSL